MKFLKSILILLFVLILGVMAVNAEDTSDNNPATDPNANACREGGSMEGRCNIDSNGDGVVSDDEVAWSWTCGWYLIRFESNLLPASSVPADCGILLSYYPDAQCFLGALWYSGVPNADENSILFLDDSAGPFVPAHGCWGDSDAHSYEAVTGIPAVVITANSFSEAIANCKAYYGTNLIDVAPLDEGLWYCGDFS